MDESRGEALEVTQAAKQSTAREAEERIRAADAEIGAKAEAEAQKLRAATDAALADIESVAAEAASDMVAKIAGMKVRPERAAAAVKAALANG
jgi:F-type H+-transporting ATPase subunit b